MEIDKILFGQLSAGKVDKSFEDLDINSDGKISEEDLSLTQDNEISSAINTVLNSIDQDEDVEILDDDLSFLDENNSASQNVAVTNQTSHTVTSNSSSVESAELQLTKLTKELDEIQEDKEQKENEYKMTEIELEKLQTNYEEAQKKAESGENMEFELTNLKLKINNLSSRLDSLKNDIERLTTKYNAKSLEVESQKQILNKAISEASETKNTNTVNSLTEVKDVVGVQSTTEVNNNTEVNSTTQTTTSSNADIDWTKLTVEGKGINVNNLFKLLANDNGKIGFSTVKAKYNSYTEEEKALVDQFYKPNDRAHDPMSLNFNPGTFLDFARFDQDGDGFLSDAEVNEMMILAKHGKTAQWPDTQVISGYRFGAHSTIVDGKKVYMDNNFIITEDEIEIYKNAMESGLSYKNAISKIMDQLGATSKCEDRHSECRGDYTVTWCTYTNGLGFESKVAINQTGMDSVNYRAINNILKLAEKEKSSD